MKTSAVKKLTRALMLVCAASAGLSAMARNDWTGGGADTLCSNTDNWSNGYSAETTESIAFVGQGGKTATFDVNAAVSTDGGYVWIGELNESYTYVDANGDMVAPVEFKSVDGSEDYGFAATAHLGIGDGAEQRGALKVSSGKYTLGGDVVVSAGGGVAYLTVAGGTVAANYWLAAGRANAQSKAYITVSGGKLLLGQGENKNGLIDLNGSGEFTVSGSGYVYAPGSKNEGDTGVALAIANNTGAITTVKINGGEIELDGSVVVGRFGTGGLEMSAGSLVATAIEGGEGSGTVTLSGGTLKAAADGAFIPSSANLTVNITGNVTLDTDGHNIVISEPLTGVGTLTVVGDGSITFTVQPECAIVNDETTEVKYNIPSFNTTVYAWSDVFVHDFEDAATYDTGWDCHSYSRGNRNEGCGGHSQESRTLLGGGESKYLQAYAETGSGNRQHKAVYTFPEAVATLKSYAIEFDWFAAKQNSANIEAAAEIGFSLYVGEEAKIKVVSNTSIETADKALVYLDGALSATKIDTAAFGATCSGASNQNRWYHAVVIASEDEGVSFAAYNASGDEVFPRTRVCDFANFTSLVLDVNKNRADATRAYSGIDDLKVRVPLLSTEDGETFTAKVDSSDWVLTAQTVDVSPFADALAGKSIEKVGDGALVLSGLPADDPCDLSVQAGSVSLRHGVRLGDVAVASDATLWLDLAGATNGEEVFGYTSLEGEVSLVGKSGRAVLDQSVNPWVITISDTYEYVWSGANGADWSDVGNWTVNGEPAVELPTADDVAVFTFDTTVYVTGDVAVPVVVRGCTLSVPAGLAFASVTFENSGKIAFSSPIAAVGSTANLITVADSEITTSNFVLPSTYANVALADGTLSATRQAGTYVWTGAKGNYWNTWGSWSVDGVQVAEFPAPQDAVTFPATADSWEVIVTDWPVVASLAVEGATKISGGVIKTAAISGYGQIILDDNGGVGNNGGELKIENPIEVVAKTEGQPGKLFSTGARIEVTGALSGDGNLELIAEFDQNGVFLNCNNGMTGGSIIVNGAWNSPNRNCSGIVRSASSDKVLWQVANGAGGNNSTHFNWFRDFGDGEYYFGSVGNSSINQPGNFKNATLIIGALNQEDTLGGRLALYSTKSGEVLNDRTWDTQFNSATIKKVGTGTLHVSAASVHNYEITGGTVELMSDSAQPRPGADPGYILFSGEADAQLKLNANFTVDISTNIAKSASGSYALPLVIDDGNVNRSLLVSIPNYYVGGFTKKGAGAMTIAYPEYSGLTTVEAGSLTVLQSNGDTFKFDNNKNAVNALSGGNVSGAVVEYFAYPEGTELDGTETEDDALELSLPVDFSQLGHKATLDFSNVVKIDISELDGAAEALMGADGLCDGYVVIAGVVNGEVKGINKNIELVLPEKPEGATEAKWRNFTVRTMTVDGKTCVCVAQGSMPFRLFLR